RLTDRHKTIPYFKRVLVSSDTWGRSISKGFDVSVMTTHGVVTLKGSLASQHAIDHVRNIARSVKGVRHVNTGELVVAGK
ncbi:BON domain-containing protein, partial [Burkholderia multivorans]